ncbi:MAG: hypothetical protein L6V85_08330 [Clostridiales bacterium]|nr:MAG: hypothetical protein L6V85_08330 [Clostridiales bacterium]
MTVSHDNVPMHISRQMIKNVVFTVTAGELPDKEYLFLKDERDDFHKVFLETKGC